MSGERKPANSDAKSEDQKPSSPPSKEIEANGAAVKKNKGTSSSLFVIGSVSVVLIGVVAAMAIQFDAKSLYYQYFTSDMRVFSRAELARHDSSITSKAWLAILGDVFDVSHGESYKKGGSYAFFTGKDSSAAFVTGDFTDEGLHDDVSTVETTNLPGIKEWNSFYHKEKNYKFIGRLNGRFYDEDGKKTDAMREFEERLKIAEAKIDAEKKLKKKYPNCNQSSGAGKPTEVWCTDKSGGVQRDWVGVPRKFSGGKKTRCACVKEEVANTMKDQMKMYAGCAPSSPRCEVVKTATK